MSLSKDLRLSFRILVAKPTFTVVAVLTLALGIGANSATFALAEAILLRPLPIADQERVVLIWRVTDRFDRSPFSIPTYRDLEQRQRSFESVALYVATNQNLTGEGEPERLEGLLVTSGFLRSLGVSVAAGRGISAEDDTQGAARALMISQELWTRRFGQEAGVIGKNIVLNNVQYTIIGVFSAGLRHQRLGADRVGDLLIPMALFYDSLPVHERENRNGTYGVARLSSEVEWNRAQEDLDRISMELKEEFPLTMSKSSLKLRPIRVDAVGETRPIVLILIAAVGSVFVLACANLAHLMLARYSHRRQEFAIRAMLGAGRGRLFRQSLTEGLVLAVLGAVGGLLVGELVIVSLPRLLPQDLIPHGGVGLSSLVVGYTVGLALVASLLISSLPALQAVRSSFNPQQMGVRGGTSRGRFRRGLVVAELAVALVLLIGSFLMTASLMRLSEVDAGFQHEGRLVLRVSLPTGKYRETSVWAGYFERALERIRGVPGVEAVGAASALPLVFGDDRSIVVAGDRPVPPVPQMSTTVFQTVSPGFHESMGIDLVEGRYFTTADGEATEPVAVVNRRFAQMFWPDRSPVDERIAFEFLGGAANPIPQWRRVAGVVEDVRHVSLQESPQAIVYSSIRQPALWYQGEWPTMGLVIRTSLDPASLAGPVREALLEIDPAQPIHDVQTFDQAVDSQMNKPRLVLQVLLSFAGIALILALLGVYGVVSLAVAGGIREMGLRLAIGASPSQLMRGVIRRHFQLILLGIALGLLSAAGLTRWMSSLLFGVSPLDAFPYLSGALLLVVAGVLAAYVPARKALRIDPAEALRIE